VIKITVKQDDNSLSTSESSLENSKEMGPFWGIDLTIRSMTTDIYPRSTVFVKFEKLDVTIPLVMDGVEKNVKIELTGCDNDSTQNLYIDTDKNCCFTWVSEKKTVYLKKNLHVELTLQIVPLTVLIEMMSLKPTKFSHPNILIEMEKVVGQEDHTIADTYDIVKTVTATQITTIIGRSNLSQGEISENFFENKIDDLQKLLSFRCKPFFSVVDINLSHQMSYFLSTLAFQKFGIHKNKLIINFDSHDDFWNSSKISFDGWGSGFFKECLQKTLSFPKSKRITYTTLGNARPLWKTTPVGIVKQFYYKGFESPEKTVSYHPDNNVYLFLKKGNVTDLWNMKFDISIVPRISNEKLLSLIELDFFEPVDQHNENQWLYKVKKRFTEDVSAEDLHLDEQSFNEFEKEFEILWRLKKWDSCTGRDFLDESIIGNLDDTDVYLSVDRDITRRSCTYWGDGFFDCKQIRSAVEKVLKHLKKKNANLVGFDIVGLPEKNIHTSFPSGNTDEYIEQAREDIRIFRELVFKYY
jgi:hypothetical protein